MNYVITYGSNINMSGLKESLLFLFHKQIKIINKLKTITDDNLVCYIPVNNNNIDLTVSFNEFDVYIYYKNLIDAVSLLKTCNEKSFIIKIDNPNEFILFRSTVKINYRYLNNIYDYYININNVFYMLTTDEYKLFFNTFKTFDLQTFIRSIKLKQLL